INDWNLSTIIDSMAREILRCSQEHQGLFEFPLSTLETNLSERKLRNVEVYEISFTAAPWFALKVLTPERIYFSPHMQGRFRPEIDHVFPRKLANPPTGYDSVVNQLWNLQPVSNELNRYKCNTHPQQFFLGLGIKYRADYDFLFPWTEKNDIDFHNPVWESPLDFIKERRRLMIAFLEKKYGIELKCG
ncbi:MAG: hypothetical protein LM514_05690, partial [Streptococcus sp.]|nr:hypothetical protein [Streptococcus sp.]